MAGADPWRGYRLIRRSLVTPPSALAMWLTGSCSLGRQPRPGLRQHQRRRGAAPPVTRWGRRARRERADRLRHLTRRPGRVSGYPSGGWSRGLHGASRGLVAVRPGTPEVPRAAVRRVLVRRRQRHGQLCGGRSGKAERGRSVNASEGFGIGGQPRAHCRRLRVGKRTGSWEAGQVRTYRPVAAGRGRVFRWSKLWPEQLEAMTLAIQGGTCWWCCPPGLGSRIHQVPALLMPGPTLVVSPLLALQKIRWTVWRGRPPRTPWR